ncbi:hypothetical protein EVAR_11288_1 [Eumeta japonica]|uniref:Uncharacterized protein n=1 Tax=Eumeta variegata TaxID=151549 RepID=A0A4C1UM54_EUMVA|nr:hypothetical protein EVAR_11288_1 [Eumeta japonica]
MTTSITYGLTCSRAHGSHSYCEFVNLKFVYGIRHRRTTGLVRRRTTSRRPAATGNHRQAEPLTSPPLISGAVPAAANSSIKSN